MPLAGVEKNQSDIRSAMIEYYSFCIHELAIIKERLKDSFNFGCARP